VSVNYNERSWAIDLIAYLNQLLSGQHLEIKKAGGEHTLQGESGTLFPDVLLFGDQEGQTILQGWELKMPDTPVTDSELIDNAERKARRLGLNSFVVWNVDQAVLYLADGDLEEYEPKKNWDLPGGSAGKRDNVTARRGDWESLAQNILQDLSELLHTGDIRERTLVEAFNNDELIEAFFDSVPITVDHLEDVTLTDGKFRAEVEAWWHNVEPEYQVNDKLTILANRSLAGWVAKIIFTHALKRVCTEAGHIENLNRKDSISDAFEVFDSITEVCNFLNVYRRELGEEHIPKRTWLELLQVNGFFSELELDSVGPEATQALLHSTVSAAKRKAAGQFTTPQQLARLLVRVTVEDQTGVIFDPFCGTGTIASAAYDEKRDSGLDASDALSTVWASDKFAFPLQAATLALSRPEHMGELQHVFQRDVIELEAGKEITFRDPNEGTDLKKPLPLADYIVSNLPFVQFEDVADSNPTIDRINEQISELTGEEVNLPSRSDLYAYLPFYLWTLLKAEGRIGLILSNAWLGTDWGREFREVLKRFYHIEKVIVSGKGRWFQNADVVTTIVVLRRRENVEDTFADEKTAYITVHKDLGELDDNKHRFLSSCVMLNKAVADWTSVQTYAADNVETFEGLGVEWTGLFSDLNWLNHVAGVLTPANSIFDIGRGERRGWNALFYPSDDHGIEGEYIEPGLKNPSSAKGLVADPDIDVFACSKSIAELENRGDSGALKWIKKFENETNGSNKPLPDVLDRAGLHWYEMRADTLADLVLPVNPYQRLFIPKLRKRSFVDQRFTRFTIRDKNVDTSLCHALMNSLIGLFLIESLGFGRGLGVLDLSTTRAKRQLNMLNPRLLDDGQKKQILSAFNPLLNRDIEPLPNELSKDDRKKLDTVVLKAFGISHLYDDIKSSLEGLYSIRMAVNQ
jgi:methylase of polypeptide subunit release factors